MVPKKKNIWKNLPIRRLGDGFWPRRRPKKRHPLCWCWTPHCFLRPGGIDFVIVWLLLRRRGRSGWREPCNEGGPKRTSRPGRRRKNRWAPSAPAPMPPLTIRAPRNILKDRSSAFGSNSSADAIHAIFLLIRPHGPHVGESQSNIRASQNFFTWEFCAGSKLTTILPGTDRLPDNPAGDAIRASPPSPVRSSTDAIRPTLRLSARRS
jgi:hypothetical protein